MNYAATLFDLFELKGKVEHRKLLLSEIKVNLLTVMNTYLISYMCRIRD
jgi:hypothetical protein